MQSSLRDDRGRRRQPRHGAHGGLLIASLIALTLLGCSSRVHTPYVPGSATAVFQPIAAGGTTFEAPDHAPAAEVLDSVEGGAGNYEIRSVEIRPSGMDEPAGAALKARYYQSTAAGTKPLVIVLPVWGVSSYPSQTIGAGLREQSAGAVNVLEIDGDHMLFDWAALGDARSEAAFQALLSRMVDRFVDTVVAIRRLVDWTQTRPEVDDRRIALIGFSMSAIVGSVVLANEPRIGVGVLVVGGADLPEILASCNGRIKRARERLRERFGWSLDEFKAQLEAPLAAIDPARFAGRLAPDRVLVIEASGDRCIPESARDQFWQALGQPERISYQYGHRATFLAMTFLGGYDLQRQVYRFLDRTVAPRLVRHEAAHDDQGAR